jgi:Ni,Fe-hydrogenase III component G
MNLSDRIKQQLGAVALEIDQPLANRLYVYVSAEQIVPAVRGLYENLGGRFQVITGLESRSAIELLYHFAFDSEGTVVTLKTKVCTAFPEIESISTLMASALWIEREVHDLLGVNFRGHPDMRRLLMSDDWPEGIHPLRRKYKL